MMSQEIAAIIHWFAGDVGATVLNMIIVAVAGATYRLISQICKSVVRGYNILIAIDGRLARHETLLVKLLGEAAYANGVAENGATQNGERSNVYDGRFVGHS